MNMVNLSFHVGAATALIGLLYFCSYLQKQRQLLRDCLRHPSKKKVDWPLSYFIKLSKALGVPFEVKQQGSLRRFLSKGSSFHTQPQAIEGKNLISVLSHPSLKSWSYICQGSDINLRFFLKSQTADTFLWKMELEQLFNCHVTISTELAKKS